MVADINARTIRGALAAGTLLALSACFTPQPLRGDFAPLRPDQVQAGGNTTVPVRWGGTLLSLSNEQGLSCVEVLARPLDSTGKPQPVQQDYGRFLACQPGYLDPQRYATGRVLTVIGYAIGLQPAQAGASTTRHARLKAEQFYLWQSRGDEGVVYLSDPYFSAQQYPQPYYAAPEAQGQAAALRKTPTTAAP
ncbi:outer membrane lipoprotein [Solimonas aquatica]|uniref:Outer membrane lipoprotein n=1 Tax=Solimonas aquatica TaxID=489703 RepID=A0A1H9FLS2_9GAMM|nr:Slp family lipoprotein [Solimonas aquatica]SEQ38897.1 outer membrane lipoprotein [Solimonas aquatica]